MNQAQRKFLIETVQTRTKAKISALKNSIPKEPSLSNHVFLAVMSGTLKLKSEAEIIEALKQKALNSKEGANWLAEDSGWMSSKTVKIERDALLVTPESYDVEYEKYKTELCRIQDEIDELTSQLDTLIIRLQLTSDKNLESIIRDVDDMGEVKLIDNKLKLLLDENNTSK